MVALPPVVLFDLDDTILRFTAGQPDAWAAAVRSIVPGADLPRCLSALNDASSAFWSDPARAFWGRMNLRVARRLVAINGLASCGIGADVAGRVGERMTHTKESAMRPFDGAVDVLRNLRQRGHRLGLLTNGCKRFQRRKLARFQLEQYFDVILIEGELGFGKPDRRVFELALEFFACRSLDAIMVGDNLVADVGGAQALGIPGVWHDCHGSGLPAAAPVPARIVGSLSELL